MSWIAATIRGVGDDLTASIEVNVPAGLLDYVDQVLVRLGYLYPDVEFTEAGGRLSAALPAGGTLTAREILHQLYREKIYQESLPMRQLMYRTLLA